MRNLCDTCTVRARGVLLLVGVAVALTMSGCVVPAERNEVSTDGHAGAAQTPEQSPGLPCYDIPTHLDDFTPKTVAVQASIYPSVFIGTFRGKGVAFWNTPGGLTPAAARAVGGDTQIFTPTVITLDTVIRGQAAAEARAMVFGGSVGCSRVYLVNSLELQPAVRYLFFGTAPVNDATGTLTDFIVLWQAWPVSDEGLVNTPEDGTLSLADVITGIEAHPVLEPGQPLPWPTGSPEASSTTDTYP